MATPNELSNG
jgi:hypothetical protein